MSAKQPRSGHDIQRKHPAFKWAGCTLEELRMLRECALKDGDMAKAFSLATEIDRKKGLY